MPMETVHEALFKAGMLDKEQEKKEEKKTVKRNIVCITKGLWVTPFKIVNIFSSWCRK